MSNLVTFILDDQRHTLSANDCGMTLLNYLRDRLDRTGTKEGCAEGDCGACTVVVVDLFNEELRYRSMNSCIQFMPTLDGKILYTVESLKPKLGGLHPVQQAMVDCHGSQCGFCTPGFVMSLFALFKNKARPTRPEISDAISGNLCRCTGYRPILDAGEKMYDYSPCNSQNSSDYQHASDELELLEKSLKNRLRSLTEENVDKEFHVDGKQFFSPCGIDKLSSLLLDHPDAKILAGGTDLALSTTKKRVDLNKVIYLGKVPELEKIEVSDRVLTIGAMATLEESLKTISGLFPQMRDMYKRFASLPIRNAGTLVGNIANGSPIGDSMPALIVLNSSVLLRKGESTRAVPLDEFYLDYMKKDLQKSEFVAAVQIPLFTAVAGGNQGAISHLGVYKISKRFEQDISAVFAAFNVTISEKIIQNVRICFGGMAATPKRALNCEQALIGKSWEQQIIEDAMLALEADYQPLTDMRASASYRMEVAKNLLLKFYLENVNDETNLDSKRRIDVRNNQALKWQ